MIDVKQIKIIRQRRKTYTLRVADDGTPYIKAPVSVPIEVLYAFAEKNRDWLEKTIAEKQQLLLLNDEVVDKILDIAEVKRGTQYKKIVGHVRTRDGSIYITAPIDANDEQIRKYVAWGRAWFEKHSSILREEYVTTDDVFTSKEIDELIKKALVDIPRRVAKWAPVVGVKYGQIRIKSTYHRWGSCTKSTGSLNFNCLLMLCPEDIIDSVVIHELCHIIQCNHSSKFYAEVLRVMPDYWDKRRWIIHEGQRFINKFRASKLPMRVSVVE